MRGAGRSGERLPVYDPAALKEQMRDVVETYGLPRPPPIKKCKRFGNREHSQHSSRVGEPV